MEESRASSSPPPFYPVTADLFFYALCLLSILCVTFSFVLQNLLNRGRYPGFLSSFFFDAFIPVLPSANITNSFIASSSEKWPWQKSPAFLILSYLWTCASAFQFFICPPFPSVAFLLAVPPLYLLLHHTLGFSRPVESSFLPLH